MARMDRHVNDTHLLLHCENPSCYESQVSQLLVHLPPPLKKEVLVVYLAIFVAPLGDISVVTGMREI